MIYYSSKMLWFWAVKCLMPIIRLQYSGPHCSLPAPWYAAPYIVLKYQFLFHVRNRHEPDKRYFGKSRISALIGLTPQPNKYLYGQRQSGCVEVRMLHKTRTDARCFVLTHQGSVSLLFQIFSNVWIHISGLACMIWVPHGASCGWGFWGVVQARPTGKMRGFEACSAYLSTTMIHGDWHSHTWMSKSPVS